MKTLDFARRYIRFDKSSPITGPFRDEFYPFLRKAFQAADDIRVKRLVIYKASSALGTVAGQIINAKRIVCDVGDQLMVCQTDDAASEWSKTRGKDWLRAIPDAMRLLSRDKYAITNDLWLFRHKFLSISGPGINSAQSIQVRFLQTDESHLDAFEPGRLIEFEKRMGGRWDRQATHITTAPDAGKEIDTFFETGQQDEWHFRCPKCAELVLPLWEDDAKTEYNGDRVFIVSGSGLMFHCPHCQYTAFDTARERYILVRDGDYIARNPLAPLETRSFRWSVFAAHWISWREILAEHRAAMEAAKLGNLKPLEDFSKKRLCKSWVPILPSFGEGRGANDYKLGDVWECSDSERFAGIDRQAGKADEGEHLWVLIVQYDRNGNSRRVGYRKVQTFSQTAALIEEFGVKPQNVYCDSGYESRSTFRECGKRHWFTTRGSDELGFLHAKRLGKSIRNVDMPYSPGELQSGIIGQKIPDKMIRHHGRGVPDGWAWQFVMANQSLYAYLSALIGGSSGRYFGIAVDFPTEYRENMPAFIQLIEKDKFGRDKKPIWKPIRQTHPWDCEIQCLLGAIRSGYYPIAKSEVDSVKT